MPPVIQARNPLRNYQFRIAVLDTGPSANMSYVAGVKGVSGLRVSITPWETWEGGNNLHRYAHPNKVTWEPVTLEQGLALDDTFEKWSEAVIAYSTDGKKPTVPVKRHVIIDIWDENMYPDGPPTLAPPLVMASPSGISVLPPITSNPQLPIDRAAQLGPRFRRYHLKNAWVSKYAPLPKLDAMTSEVALLSVELVHEGWKREDINSTPPAS